MSNGVDHVTGLLQARRYMTSIVSLPFVFPVLSVLLQAVVRR